MKALLRFFTSRESRCHKRRVFFEAIFQSLKDSIGAFTGIKCDGDSFTNSCHDLAGTYPFYPLDLSYEMDIGEFFDKYCHQTYTRLKVRIVRQSPILYCIFSRRCKYKITVDVCEHGTAFDFSYWVKYSSAKASTI